MAYWFQDWSPYKTRTSWPFRNNWVLKPNSTMRSFILALWGCCLLVANVSAQNIGTLAVEEPLNLPIQVCTAPGACTAENDAVVLDSNWRWAHTVSISLIFYAIIQISIQLMEIQHFWIRLLVPPIVTLETCGTLPSAPLLIRAQPIAPLMVINVSCIFNRKVEKCRRIKQIKQWLQTIRCSHNRLDRNIRRCRHW